MKPLFLAIALLLYFPFTRAQTINVRIWPDRIDSFTNFLWNSWFTGRGITNDTSQAFMDIYGNKTKIRGVLGTDGNTFDNGPSYLPGQSWLPDTVLRKGAWFN